MHPTRRLSTLLALLAVASAGPASAADEVPRDQAELRLHAAMSGTNASSFFDGYGSEACEDGKGPGRLATFNFFAKKEQSELVAAGAPLYVLGVLHVTPKAGEHMLKNACRSMRNCPITIKDARTGAEVKTQKVKPKGACREKK